MRYMVDTNTFIYLCNHDYDKLDRNVMSVLDNFENNFIISSESIREISLLIRKKIIGVEMWRTYADVKSSLEGFGMEIRYVDETHLKIFYSLEYAPGHNDPFDLMIVAQAIAEKLPLISSDTDFPFYTRQGLDLFQNFNRKKRR